MPQVQAGGAPILSCQDTAIGDQLYPAVAPDGILFQGQHDKISGIYLLHPVNHTNILLTAARQNASHPVWVPQKPAIVYDTGTGLKSRLMELNLNTGKEKRLIRRKIACREASFTPSRHLVAFSGFDDKTQRWQVFTYDFVYDNLNRLTTEEGNCRFPVFSPDGKHIVFTVQNDNGIQMLKIMNWYGKDVLTLHKNVMGRACWTPDNWRILFMTLQNNAYQLLSVRKDGTGILKTGSFRSPVCCPLVMPNGEIWISGKKGKLFRLQHLSQQGNSPDRNAIDGETK